MFPAISSHRIQQSVQNHSSWIRKKFCYQKINSGQNYPNFSFTSIYFINEKYMQIQKQTKYFKGEIKRRDFCLE